MTAIIITSIIILFIVVPRALQANLFDLIRRLHITPLLLSSMPLLLWSPESRLRVLYRAESAVSEPRRRLISIVAAPPKTLARSEPTQLKWFLKFYLLMAAAMLAPSAAADDNNNNEPVQSSDILDCGRGGSSLAPSADTAASSQQPAAWKEENQPRQITSRIIIFQLRRGRVAAARRPVSGSPRGGNWTGFLLFKAREHERTAPILLRGQARRGERHAGVVSS